MFFQTTRAGRISKYAFLFGSASLVSMLGAVQAQAQSATSAQMGQPVPVAGATSGKSVLVKVAQATPSTQTVAPSNQATPVQVAQAAVAQAAPSGVPEQVLVTGSLIHGAAAVGVPVTSFRDGDFKETGALTIADLFKNVPAVYQIPQNDVIAGGGYIARAQNVNLRNLSTHGSRQLLLVDGLRFPNQGRGGCQTDPSIIPQLALERLDILADGASATYGSDAIVGVINVVLKRGYDGAISQAQYSQSTDIGHPL